MTWTRLLVLPASMTTPYPWGRRRGERDRRRRRRSARADAAARRRRPRPPREPIMEEMEANGSKYQQQKLGDVPSSQPHHLNQVTPALTACRSTTSRRLRRGASSARPPLLLLRRRRLRAIPNVIPSEHGRAADHAGFLDAVDPLLNLSLFFTESPTYESI
uniref:Uncharacterized protein n=1 Tax=Oryza glumipatula TaxID=40148 RepID=A0A0E0ATY9_9ORYZ